MWFDFTYRISYMDWRFHLLFDPGNLNLWNYLYQTPNSSTHLSKSSHKPGFCTRFTDFTLKPGNVVKNCAFTIEYSSWCKTSLKSMTLNSSDGSMGLQFDGTRCDGVSLVVFTFWRFRLCLNGKKLTKSITRLVL